MTYTIPGRLPGYNELNVHWAKRQKIKQDAMDLVGWHILAQGIQRYKDKVTVGIRCYEPNKRRDPSNVRAGAEKVILDALQNMGIIRNDNWRWLEDKPATVEVDPQNPHIEIQIDLTKEGEKV